MKIRGSSYLSIVIMALMLVAIGLSLRMEFWASKLLPLLFSGLVFVMAAVGLGREILAKHEPEAVVTEDTTGRGEGAGEGWRGYLVNGAWVFGFFLGIYLVGFIIAIPLFVLAYIKLHGAKWPTAIFFAVVMPAFIYGVFELALGVILYRGLLFGEYGY